MSAQQRTNVRYGQHFLVSGHIADRIIESAHLNAHDIVLEIGPGKGILTERLIEKVQKVIAVEVDRKLAEELKRRFWGKKNFHIVIDDILSIDLPTLFSGEKDKVKVVSNIPYYISTPIIELLIKNRSLVSHAVLMVQKEVAKRILAQPGSKEYGLTSINVALCADVKRVMDVKPGAFTPPPAVISSVISLVFNESYRYPLNDADILWAVTGAAFRGRRKMIRNTFVPYLVSLGITESDAQHLLATAGVDGRERPEALDVGTFVALSNALGDFFSRHRVHER